jgi:hypothetical protein
MRHIIPVRPLSLGPKHFRAQIFVNTNSHSRVVFLDAAAMIIRISLLRHLLYNDPFGLGSLNPSSCNFGIGFNLPCCRRSQRVQSLSLALFNS